MPKEKHDSKGSQKAQRISNPMHKRLYTLIEAGDYLGRSVYSVRTLVWKGALPCVKDGKKQWIDISDMDNWIQKHKEVVI